MNKLSKDRARRQVSRTGARIWLLSAYRSDSHAAWSDWLVSHLSAFDWRVKELPGRHFAWRIRGNALSWLDDLPGVEPDLLVATSMVDLATLKGLHPRLSGVPSIYYFHENQFAFPRSDRQVTSVDAQMVQLYGALSADRVLFNSEFNRRTFLAGIDGLLSRMPDRVPERVRQRIAAKCGMLPVPIEPVTPADARDNQLIVWNHRWEYDKAPELFADAIQALAERGVRFRLALLGARPPKPPTALSWLRASLGDRIVADARLEREQYRRLLGRAGIVVSTARHEFQGLGVLEAASAGARPLVPDALCYPEQYSAAYRYPPGDAEALADRLEHWLGGGLPGPVDVTRWTPERQTPAWHEALAAAAQRVQG